MEDIPNKYKQTCKGCDADLGTCCEGKKCGKQCCTKEMCGCGWSGA